LGTADRKEFRRLREAWVQRQFGLATAVAAPVGFGRARPQFSLVVDLAQDIFSKQWWRGAATLATLIIWALMLGPGIVPLPAGTPGAPPVTIEQQWDATGIGPLSSGSPTGMRMAANGKVEAIAEAPERAFVDLFATVGRDGLARSLMRIGASPGDAIKIETLVRGEGGHVRPGTDMSVTLGRKEAAGQRSVEKLVVRTGLDMRMMIERGNAGLILTKLPIAVDRSPIRIRGRAGDGLYWALRAAGASPQSAAEYLKALATEIDVGEVAPDDRFDLVFANQHTATGENAAGPLLYAGLERSGQRSLQLVAWNVGGKISWVDATSTGQPHVASDAMIWPVNARITSGFGMRYHPILHFARMHKGIDFGASWGSPIVATADGQVTEAGWAGGYGRQVRIAHGGGITTSYSHMSRMVVEPGMLVHQGQLIGYVGSSGLSTGPHLHYEVLRSGSAVNPMSVRIAAGPSVDPGVTEAIKARLKALLSIGKKA
jgi:murein DD-endopeptidase MepM/ murein hydrolase activator NlpD